MYFESDSSIINLGQAIVTLQRLYRYVVSERHRVCAFYDDCHAVIDSSWQSCDIAIPRPVTWYRCEWCDIPLFHVRVSQPVQ